MFSKKNKVGLIAVALMLVIIVSGCTIVESGNNVNQETNETAIIIEEQYGDLARDYVEKLSNDIGNRVAGTPKEVEAAKWIFDTFVSMGYEPEIQPFKFVDGDQEKNSQNVIALKEGESDTVIILGAHYDSVSEGKGADDNASGVAVLMEIANKLDKLKTPYTIKFAFFGAEENYLDGSFSYTANMTEEEISKTLVMVNLDSLIAGDISYAYGDDGDNGKYRDWILDKAKELDLEIVTQTENGIGIPYGTTGDWSDHAPFKEIGIPYVYLESTNWSIGELDGFTQVEGNYGVNGEIWHTSHDNLNYLDENFKGRTDMKLSTFSEVLTEFLQHKF